MLVACLLFGSTIASAQMIKTKTPARAKGQQDVLRLATAPIPTVRVAFIGLGMRGPGAVERMTHIPGVEIVALCDMTEKNTQSANELLTKAGLPKAQEFFGDENAWKKVTALPNVDLVYIATDWKHHAQIGCSGQRTKLSQYNLE